MSTPTDSLSALGTMFMRSLRIFYHARTLFLVTIFTPVLLWVFQYGFFKPQTFAVIESLRTDADASTLTDAWYFSSVIVLTAFVTTAAVMVGFLTDTHSGKLGLHLSTGAKAWQIIWGYILAATLVGVIASVCVVVFGQVWALAFGQPIIPVSSWLGVLGGILLGTLFFAALHAGAVTLTHSHGAFGAYTFLMGTTSGVLSFAFTVNLRVGMTQVVGFLPFAQIMALIREPLLRPGLNSAAQRQHELEDLLGVHIHQGHGGEWAIWLVVACLIGWIILATIFCHYRVNRLLNGR